MNKAKKTINGNNNNNLCIMTWNKADTNIEDKMFTIKQYIIKYSPKIFFVMELNLNFTQNSGTTNIPGYNFVSDSLLDLNQTSRIGM